MDIKSFLNKVCEEIKYKPARKGISEELELHIQEIKEDFINKGINSDEAEEKAVSQMGIAEEIGKKLNKVHRPKFDWKLAILITILIGFGILVAILKEPSLRDTYILSTITYIIIGTILSIGIYFFDYRKLKSFSNLIYIIATIIMILSITVFNNTMGGGWHYINIFGITINPVIVSIPLYIIAFVGFITNYNKNNNIKIQGEEISINKHFIKILFCTILSLFLIIKVQSLTNAAILCMVYLVLGTIKIIQDKEKVILKLSIIYGLILLSILMIFILSFMGSPFRINRIVSSFNPELDPNGAGYTGMLQKEILENAKLIGEADTPIVKTNDYIVSEDSNFTFIYLLGKTGILTVSLLIITLILTFMRLIINSKNIKDSYGKNLVIGLSTLFIIQSVSSVLMNINLGIKANINLPFVTYGAVYFIVNIVNIAIILSVYRRKDINLYENEIKDNSIIRRLGLLLLNIDKKIKKAN